MGLGKRAYASAIVASQLFALSAAGASILPELAVLDRDQQRHMRRPMQPKASRKKRGK